MNCPCGKGPTLEECCGRYLNGESIPATAEALMRSRYTAVAKGRVDYLFETHHPETRSQFDERETAEWVRTTRWQRLDIVEAMHGRETDDEGRVEFVAHYVQHGEECVHHELSVFRKHEGRWYYYDYEAPTSDPVVREKPKVGRNAPCPCGSGKKYKKCCGRSAKQ